MALTQKFLFTILLLISILFLIFANILPILGPVVRFAFIVIALVFDVLAFSTKYYMAFFIPILKMHGRTAVIDSSEAFRMAPSSNAIVVRRDSDVFASAFVKIPTYRSATEMNAEEKIDFTKLFSRALTVARQPVRFGAQFYVINKDLYINNVKNKLNEAEERYQTASLNSKITKSESERIRGEVTMWHNLFDSVSKVKSHALEAYAMTTAEGGNEDEAINLALQQADELATGLSAVFGVTASIIEGPELLRFLEPEYMIPSVTLSEQMVREESVPGQL